MKMPALYQLILMIVAVVSSTVPGLANVSEPEPLKVFILAGQSNLLNWHADATHLPPDSVDKTILFYYHTGAPPRHPAFPADFFNATSCDAWTTLGPQVQEPYHKFHRVFFGPEVTLGRQLATTGLSKIALIKIGYFGTNLAKDWHPDASTGNQLYALLHRQVTTALDQLQTEGDPFRVAGFFWIQGEGDSSQADFAIRYEKNLIRLINCLREDFGAPDTPFVVVRIPPSERNPYTEQVRSAQVRVASAKGRIGWVNTDDLLLDFDGVHFLAPGVITLGERLADAWQQLDTAKARSTP